MAVLKPIARNLIAINAAIITPKREKHHTA
jgi:hypothetical protein